MYAFAVLGVSPLASDEQIRAAYLAKVRIFPPDTEPQRFKEVSAAYERIKTAELRRGYLLGPQKPEFDEPFDALRGPYLLEEKRVPPDLRISLRPGAKSCSGNGQTSPVAQVCIAQTRAGTK